MRLSKLQRRSLGIHLRFRDERPTVSALVYLSKALDAYRGGLAIARQINRRLLESEALIGLGEQEARKRPKPEEAD